MRLLNFHSLTMIWIWLIGQIIKGFVCVERSILRPAYLWRGKSSPLACSCAGPPVKELLQFHCTRGKLSMGPCRRLALPSHLGSQLQEGSCMAMDEVRARAV